MILRIFGHDFHYECENLCRVYFPNEKINIVYDDSGEDSKSVITCCEQTDGGNFITVEAVIDGESRAYSSKVIADGTQLRDKSELKTAQLIFKALSELTGYTPPWGVLTGVRPSKLMLRLISQHGEQDAKRYFTEDLLVSEEKTALAMTVADSEKKIIDLSRDDSFSLYVSIPFCPSRCSYCSFVSHSLANPNPKKLFPQYLEKLEEEI